MLKPEYRLKKRSAFTATYRTNHSCYEDGITVFCGRKKTIDIPTKIGFVVSKKIHKRAVKRNRIKRLLRETCRLYIKEKGLNCNYISLVFVASSKFLNKNYKDICPIINKLMDKVTYD